MSTTPFSLFSMELFTFQVLPKHSPPNQYAVNKWDLYTLHMIHSYGGTFDLDSDSNSDTKLLAHLRQPNCCNSFDVAAAVVVDIVFVAIIAASINVTVFAFVAIAEWEPTEFWMFFSKYNSILTQPCLSFSLVHVCGSTFHSFSHYFSHSAPNKLPPFSRQNRRFPVFSNKFYLPRVI